MDQDEPRSQRSVPPLEPDDFYLEGLNLVFTAAYHRKRGYCCGSGCRHCPYRDGESEDRQHLQRDPDLA